MRSIFKNFKIPRFFKTKKFFVFLFLFILFFLFTPISLRQVGNKVEGFINDRATEGVQAFENQTGLKIEWELLQFNIFTMNVHLEGVQVIPLNTANFKKIQELGLLDGRQKIQKISARPSLFSLLFKKRVVLAKLKIQKGDIYIKTLKSFLRKSKAPQDMALPIKHILIKNTQLSLRHQGRGLKLSRLRSSVRQKKEGIFHFNFFVESFHFSEDPGFEAFSNYLPGVSIPKNENAPAYQLAFKGVVQKGRVFFEKILLKNHKFQSITERLDLQFDSKKLKQMNIRSSGALPFVLIQKGIDWMGGETIFFDSLLSYKLNIQYTTHKGYKGSFDLNGENAVFKTHKLKSFFAKGRLRRRTLFLDSAKVEVQNQGRAYIKNGEWFFHKASSRFGFLIETHKLSSDFVAQAVLNMDNFPVKGDFTGSIKCQGKGYRGSYFKCSAEGKSKKVSAQTKDQNELVSLHGMNLDLNVEWDREILNFLAIGTKTTKSETSKVQFQGQYSQPSDRLESSYSFIGKWGEDLKFNTAFPVEGTAEIRDGKLIVEKNKVQFKGFLSSSLIKIQSYKLKDISSRYQFKTGRLAFVNIKSSPGRTNWAGEGVIDFRQKELVLNWKSSFFDIEDLMDSVQENISWPISFKGTGAGTFFIRYPWALPEKKEFHLKGDLFNVSVNKDLFQQATFNFSLQNDQGVIRSLLLKKGQGYLKGSGFFDSQYALNLKVKGQDLSLERLEWLNSIVPFNQSGDVNFDMKITGTLARPKIHSDIFISNMFFYSYPVKDSHIKMKLDAKALSLSGPVMDEIFIDQFIYPFSKKALIKARGRLANLDFIKLLFSKNRMERAQERSSQLTGFFSFHKTKEKTSQWTGQAQIDQFFVSRSDQWIKGEKPFSIFFDKDRWSLSSGRFSYHNKENLIIEERGPDKLWVSGRFSLGLFSVLFPFLKKIEGDVRGQVLIDNNLKQPSPKGSVRVDKALFSVGTLPDFKEAQAQLDFAGNRILVHDFFSHTGGSSLKGKGLVFYDFIHWPKVDLDLDFSGAQLNIPKDFQTKGKGRLKIHGDNPPYLISGEYLIDSGTITKEFSGRVKKTKHDFSFLKKKKQKEDSLFNLDLNIQTNQAVEINSSLIRSAIKGQIRIYGPLESLLADGQFAISKTAEENLIFFRGTEFKVSSGSVLFKNSSLGNPYLDISANTLFKEQIIDPLEGNQEIERAYKIFLSLKGFSQEPDFSLKSSPVLNEKEIISLLTLGVGSRYFDANVRKDVIDYSYQILGSLFLEKILNKEIKDTLGWDFRPTSYINTLNKPVTKITLSKNWFEKWKTSFSRTIEENAQSDIRLKYNLNKKISLTAFWENTRQTDLETDQNDRLGLDFEFNLDF